jgi:hypothetical protein
MPAVVDRPLHESDLRVRDGRRYRPLADGDELPIFPLDGVWYVCGRASTWLTDPGDPTDPIAMAAVCRHQDALCAALVGRSVPRPARAPAPEPPSWRSLPLDALLRDRLYPAFDAPADTPTGDRYRPSASAWIEDGWEPRRFFVRARDRYRAVGEDWRGFPGEGVWRVVDGRWNRVERIGALPAPLPRADAEAHHAAVLAVLAADPALVRTRPLSAVDLVRRFVRALAGQIAPR